MARPIKLSFPIIVLVLKPLEQPQKISYYTACTQCKGIGKKSRRLRKSQRLGYQRAVAVTDAAQPPARPRPHLDMCLHCAGTGIVAADNFPTPDTDNYPHIAIIGAGIGGVALAVACLHRGIPYTLYERDSSFDERSQGYGLTLQQASKAIEALGIASLADGIVSTRHIVHNTDGQVLGEWGMRKWLAEAATPKRSNIHIARQSLRLALLQQLSNENRVQWGHQFLAYKGSDLRFEVEGNIKHATADLVVGADGIRSAVRSLLIPDTESPLRYLGCIVILGICPLSALVASDSPLLDGATVFQTANGVERIYMMPFATDSVMWQLSFPMPEDDAKALSIKGAEALKAEALSRCQWHAPIPQIIAATQAAQVSGYPVYDRALLSPASLANAGAATLIGDAAHPMSPFKGQGANQAILDALSLARSITQACRPLSGWQAAGIRASVLDAFEREMCSRSAIKVQDSADAAAFLHSDIVLQMANEPRGRSIKRKKEQ
ncbi:MAG: FAD-dependent monooxygenase [Chitinophagaceae bacterium]|nr:FAD-dependent monooxygenase [Chitinophagaceae bacterium]